MRADPAELRWRVVEELATNDYSTVTAVADTGIKLDFRRRQRLDLGARDSVDVERVHHAESQS